MKIQTTVRGGLAVDCRTNIYFGEGEVLEVGSKSTAAFRGLSEGDLKELLNLKLAKQVSEKLVKDISEVLTEEVPAEYELFTDKDELEIFAREIYGIELDKRKTLKKMKNQLENALGGDL